MTKTCPTCGIAFRNGDEILALMRSVYRQIPSRVAYAIEEPVECVSLYHDGCWMGDR